ncbi:MAG: HAD-IA family hydrolase [Candidatus Eisenbacteria bacterium]|nr:HAD-IA family hydrolase [Candidatus Eisenbacteria bacterium]
MANADLVILDLDGTLYSSTATTLGAVRNAVDDLNARHGPVVTLPGNEMILSGIGSTREQFARKVFPTLPEMYIEEIDQRIWHWERTLVNDGRGALFPGAVEALDDMRAMGLRLAVATNAGSGYMNHILDYFGIRDCFDDTRCAGEERTEDKGALIDRILLRLAVLPERAVMVGDRSTDIDGARRSGTRAVGCTWGFASRDELAGADRIVESFGDLTRLLTDWP